MTIEQAIEVLRTYAFEPERQQAVDTILSRLEADRWVPVKTEKPPSNGVPVLVFSLDDKKVRFAYYNDLGFFYAAGGGQTLKVKHWRPLPHPPNEAR